VRLRRGHFPTPPLPEPGSARTSASNAGEADTVSPPGS
jgi:hypothetical protein